MFTSRMLLLWGLLVLPGCSVFSPNPYVASTRNLGWGYAEAPVAPDTVEVGYVGMAGYETSTAQLYATFRAAEVTLDAGKPYFEILLESTSTGWRTEDYAVTTTDSDGNDTTTWYTRTYYYPMETLLIRMVDGPRAGALDAGELLQEARRRGVGLAPETVANLEKK